MLSGLELEGCFLNMIKGQSKNLPLTIYIKSEYQTLAPNFQAEPDKDVYNCHFCQLCISG